MKKCLLALVSCGILVSCVQNKNIDGTVAGGSGAVSVVVSKAVGFSGALTKDVIDKSVVSKTTTTNGQFSLSVPKDCPDCYIAAYTEAKDRPNTFTCMKLDQFNGFLSLKTVSALAKKAAGGTPLSLAIATYSVESGMTLVDQIFTSFYDNCPDAPFFVPSLKNSSNYLFHLVSCANYAGGDLTIDPIVRVSPNVGYKSRTNAAPLDEGGTGFHSCLITLCFTDPDGISSYVTEQADANGTFSHLFKVSDHQELKTGTWTYYAVDCEGSKSQTISFQILP